MPIVKMLHSATKYAGDFGVDDHHAGEMIEFNGWGTDRRDPTPVLKHPGNLTTPWRETMVTKDNAETWEYY